MAEAKGARALLAELEELALRTLAQETERLRRALEEGDHSAVMRCRMSVLDALELFERAHGAVAHQRREHDWAREDGHEGEET
jgi:hypothetical protein